MGSVFSVEGNVLSILATLTKHGITARNVKEKEGKVTFSTYGKDVKRTEELLKRTNRKYSVIKDGTARTFFKKNILRIGLYLGIILAIVLCVRYADTVRHVDINDLKVVEEDRILGLIAEEISLPERKKNIDTDLIKKKILALEGVSYTSVRVEGSVLVVTVMEEPPLPSVVDKSDYSFVTAKYDGIVTRIITYSGTATVEVGDTVLRGDDLIAPYVVSPNELQIPTNALGEIYARVWVTKEIVICPTVKKEVRTGRTERRARFFAKKRDYDGKFFSYEEEVLRYYLGGVIPLPYYVTVYYETELREVEYDFEEEKESIVAEATEELKSSLPKGSIPLRTWYEAKRVDKNTHLVIYYEVDTRID